MLVIGIILISSIGCATVINNKVQMMPSIVKEKIAILVDEHYVSNTTSDVLQESFKYSITNTSDNHLLNVLQSRIISHNKEYIVFTLPNKNKEIENLIETLRDQNIVYATICSNKFSNDKYIWLKPITKFFNKYNNNNNIKSILANAGIILIHPHNIIGTDIAHCGLLTTARPSSQNIQDIASGIFILNNLSKTNTGQSAISQLGNVIAIETEIENTEHLIQRCISSKLNKKGGVLIKTTKPKQKESLVFPTIDINTILKAKEANLDGIVINANYCRIIDINKTIKLANKKNIFMLSI